MIFKCLKNSLLTLLLLLVSHSASAQPLSADSVPSRKKVAVVLSGGGAFGAIHVGFLKVLEEAGIPVDMVVGTSMGSIVGSLYSVGYDSDDIATMFREMDWTELFLDRDDPGDLTLSEREMQDAYIYERDFYVHGGVDPQPGGVIRGTNVENTFRRYLHGYTDSLNFLRDLPRQFACVATDLVTDSEVVLTHGSLVKSIRSSMSIPGVFTPVHLGDMVLVDGGAKNNFAADVARKLGADIVIGVKFDLALGTDKQYRTLIDVLERSAGSDVRRRAQENEKYCDLLIKVPVRGFTSGSFKKRALITLMERGEKATREKWDDILALKAAAVGSDDTRDYKMHLRDIHDTDNYVEQPGKLSDNRHDENTIRAAIGLRFDTEDLAALLLGGRYFLAGKHNKELDLTLRLGLRSMLRVNFDFEPRRLTKMGASYEFWYNYYDIYTKGSKSNSLSYLYQHASVKLFSLDAPNFDCELGVGWDHYHHFKGLWNDKSETTVFPNEHYFNYHARVRYNSEDRRYFTRRGTRAEAQLEYCTDNFAHWKGHSGFGIITALWQTTVPLSSSTRVRPQLQGRLLFGDDLPLMCGNVAGGMSYGKFFRHQMPLAGIGHSEFFDSKFLSASLRVQQRIVGRHYLLLDGSVAEHNDELKRIFDNKPLWGVQLGYFYNSGILGPIGVVFGWNSHTERLNVLLSLGLDF